MAGTVGTDGFPAVDEDFLEAYKLLCNSNSRALTCVQINTVYESRFAPKVVIIDVGPAMVLETDELFISFYYVIYRRLAIILLLEFGKLVL